VVLVVLSAVMCFALLLSSSLPTNKRMSVASGPVRLFARYC